MKRDQITRDEIARSCANHGSASQKSKNGQMLRIRVRKKTIKWIQITLVRSFIIFLVTVIMCNVISIKENAEKQEEEIEDYIFITEERGESFSANYTKAKFETKNIRVPLAFAELTYGEDVALYEDNECYKVVLANEFRAEKVVERFLNEHAEYIEEPTESETIPEEYRPIKLFGYEISATGPYEHYVYILSEEDMKIIAKVVWAEARGECYKGKVAVAAVILNRYFSDDPHFSRESILHTATQSGQFASIWNVTDSDLNNVTDCMEAVKDACRGWDPTREVFEEGALFFYAPKGVSGYQAKIREGIKVMVIGNHNFHFDFEKVNG